jgi:uncharacterized protein YjbI with pentapeptide repeats
MMNRSRLSSTQMSSSAPDDTASETSSTGLRLPLLVILIGLITGATWFFQQVGLRHLNGRIHQLQKDIDKLPNRSLTPADRISLQKEQIMLERDRINSQNGVYNILFQGIGASILGGLAYTSWQYLRRNEDRSRRSDYQTITNRFSQAIGHLASEKMEIRIGGIYELEHLAQAAPSEHWLTIEVLTAFVRERSQTLPAREPSIMGPISPLVSGTRRQSSRIPTDVQSVMTVLSRRDVSKDRSDRVIELRASNLRDADLNGIELPGADLWKVNLREAQLWQAKLAGTSLGRANLIEASLWQADLAGAYLWRANLEGANLSEANLARANLEGSNLTGANLHQTNLADADLRKVVGLTREQLSHAICNQTTQLPDYL